MALDLYNARMTAYLWWDSILPRYMVLIANISLSVPIRNERKNGGSTLMQNTWNVLETSTKPQGAHCCFGPISMKTQLFRVRWATKFQLRPDSELHVIWTYGGICMWVFWCVWLQNLLLGIILSIWVRTVEKNFGIQGSYLHWHQVSLFVFLLLWIFWVSGERKIWEKAQACQRQWCN